MPIAINILPIEPWKQGGNMFLGTRPIKAYEAFRLQGNSSQLNMPASCLNLIKEIL